MPFGKGKEVTGDVSQFMMLWESDARYRASFDESKRLLSSPPVLAVMDPEAEFIVLTDAGNFAIGSTLCQIQPWAGRPVERMLSFLRRKLSATECRYPTYDREVIAVIGLSTSGSGFKIRAELRCG